MGHPSGFAEAPSEVEEEVEGDLLLGDADGLLVWGPAAPPANFWNVTACFEISPCGVYCGIGSTYANRSNRAG
jgi:hypothetical protein